MAKQVLFYGKALEELQKMPLQEFARLLKSRSRRSLIRRMEEVQKFLQRVDKKVKRGKTMIKTHERDMIITPQLVGLTVAIHNGKEFTQVKITESMLGHFLGEFAMTRKRVTHGSAGIGATRSSAAAKSKAK